ncbi:TPA: thiamine-phosphate pyrophosphorylase [bacterium]|nr:thiamine-phosphate pyrophosphorylase [bacterium]
MKNVLRIIDANLNRSREGLRVAEELARFVLNNANLASQMKSARHEITLIARQLPISDSEFLLARDSISDVGAELNSESEDTRINLSQIAIANIRRAEESMRVLEELSKLYSSEVALEFKRLRFRLYEIEKLVLTEIIQYEK